MPEISFYHFTCEPLEKALPRLMEKVYSSNKHAVIMAADTEQVEALNKSMWTYATMAFVPHGSQADGFADQQPIWLTTKEENPNNAEILVLTNGQQTDFVEKFSRCLDVFDGNDRNAVQQASERVSTYKNKGYDVTYWLQGERGNWIKQDIERIL